MARAPARAGSDCCEVPETLLSTQHLSCTNDRRDRASVITCPSESGEIRKNTKKSNRPVAQNKNTTKKLRGYRRLEMPNNKTQLHLSRCRQSVQMEDCSRLLS